MSDQRLSIECSAADNNGRRKVVAILGKKKHIDRFDIDDSFKRSKFSTKVIELFDLDEGAHEWLSERITAAAESQTDDSLIQLDTVKLSDVQPEAVEPLWPNRFYVGKLGLIVGDPGKGKSFLTLDMAARISRGAPWPDAPGVRQPAGDVLLMTGEDDLADTVRPRLDAHEADVSRIIAIRGVKGSDVDGDYERLVNLSTDLERIRNAVKAADNPRAINIDPISAYLGKVDSHVNAQVRGVLEPLGKMASELRVAVIAVSHLRKGEGAALYRTMGSLAFIATARTAWVVCQDEADASRRLLLPLKSNLGPDVGGLAFSIRSYAPSCPPVVAWEAEPVTVAADDAIGQKRKRGPAPDMRTEAADWLREQLANGPRPAKELIDEGDGYGFSRRTIYRAFKDINGTSKTSGFPAIAVWCASRDNAAQHKQPGTPGTTASIPEEEEEVAMFRRNGSVAVPSTESVDQLDPFEDRHALNGQHDTPF